MTIFWSKCDYCGKHRPVNECKVGRTNYRTCFTCYTLLGLSEVCGAWPKIGGIEKETEKDKIKEIEELLEILES